MTRGKVPDSHIEEDCPSSLLLVELRPHGLVDSSEGVDNTRGRSVCVSLSLCVVGEGVFFPFFSLSLSPSLPLYLSVSHTPSHLSPSSSVYLTGIT